MATTRTAVRRFGGGKRTFVLSARCGNIGGVSSIDSTLAARSLRKRHNAAMKAVRAGADPAFALSLVVWPPASPEEAVERARDFGVRLPVATTRRAA